MYLVIRFIKRAMSSISYLLISRISLSRLTYSNAVSLSLSRRLIKVCLSSYDSDDRISWISPQNAGVACSKVSLPLCW